ncbi:MAG: glutamate--tRNA ligase [Anaerolineales bacterium]|nr:glutamate--tRNA ligase [Anaerolineae bacterium]PWB53037.1 MAG: glutamate--tRNA ligase [Anaerolineales bacterium]
MAQLNPVRVRFAPSPTGRTHLGSGRTALYNYLLARQTGGTFILRIEDTDQKRYVPGAEQELIDSLHWLGIDWDEGPGLGGPHGPYYQTQRREIYAEHARRLIESGHAYYCFCSPERLEQVRREQQSRKENPRYDGLCRRLNPAEAAARVANGERHVIRFKVPESGSITAHDLLRGDITVENSALDDHVIVRSDGLALYHLAAMVDDHLMDITHVIRGSEWLSTFPLHAHIIRAFGWQEPEFIHLSVFLKPSGKGKMSKRETSQLIQDGYSIFIKDLKDLGYIPEGVVNWVALMGWSYDDRTEFFTLQELVQKFNLEHLNPSPAAINFTKLDYFNGLHIRNLPNDDLAQRLAPYIAIAGLQLDEDKLLQAIPIIRERLVTLDDVIPVAGFLFKDEVTPVPAELIGDKLTSTESAHIARQVYTILSGLPEIDKNQAEPLLREFVEQSGLKPGQVFGIIRAAVTGQKNSPPLFECMEIIGKEKILERINTAAHTLEKM